MNSLPHFRLLLLCSLAVATAAAAPLTVTVAPPAPPRTDGFKMGTERAPDGSTITLDSRSLFLDGRRWTPVMGEFHYTRYPAAEWREELLKMKAGGIDIVATYVFWIHHEEIEGQWEWSGDKDLRRFIETARDVGLKAIVRCGPWCHGEARNGGLPDWIVARGNTRSEDPAFLASTTKLYQQIASQLQGLLWKDGGPVIGIQFDNEYGGPASYLLALKRIARELGLDVPLYTRTGWPALSTPMPFGEIIPLYGVYAEGFWDRETTSMPGNYWAGFHFSKLRIDGNIANEALGRREVKDPGDVADYPYLTCEIGGGMMSSYHRRILVDSRDIESTTLVKIGSGSVSPGYYMYHGGTNPEGKLTTLMEAQDTALTNWNDMPVKNYDFQTALGQYGQVRPQFHTLRRLHLFLRDFGARLAEMDTFLPDRRPEGKDDITTLRWAVRADGRSGFVFVNNYERGRELPAKEGVQFSVKLADGSAFTFPDVPVTVPKDAVFVWPFNLAIVPSGKLAWATAQPLGVTGTGSNATWYFAETPGVPAEFVFTGVRVISRRGRVEVRGDSYTRVVGVTAGRDPALILNSSVKVILLDAADSLALRHEGKEVWFMDLAPKPAASVQFEQIRSAGPAREIPLAATKQPVAVHPGDSDFDAAAVWKIKLPADIDLSKSDLMLRLHYAGDVARVYIGEKFITDDYYNGNPLEIGLRRHAAELKSGEMTIAILPLRKDAITGEKPLIFMAESAKPDFGANASIAELRAVEIVNRPTITSAADHP
jgi:beta-galactosidase